MKFNQNKFEQEFFEPFSKIVDELFPKEFQDWAHKKFSNFGIYIPAANIVETKDTFELEMTAPGRAKKEFTIQFTDGKLIISAERKALDDLQKEDTYMRKEFAYPEIYRRFLFPKNAIQMKEIKASYKNGILRVVLPKLDTAKYGMGRTIEVD